MQRGGSAQFEFISYRQVSVRPTMRRCADACAVGRKSAGIMAMASLRWWDGETSHPGPPTAWHDTPSTSRPGRSLHNHAMLRTSTATPEQLSPTRSHEPPQPASPAPDALTRHPAPAPCPAPGLAPAAGRPPHAPRPRPPLPLLPQRRRHLGALAPQPGAPPPPSPRPGGRPGALREGIRML